MKRFLHQMSSREALILIGFGVVYSVAVLVFLHLIGH
jgi:hypothetical protein